MNTDKLSCVLSEYRHLVGRILNEHEDGTFPVHNTEAEHHRTSIKLIDELLDHLFEGPEVGA